MSLTANATHRRANLIGCAWMLAAMAGSAVENSVLKAAAQSLPVIAGSSIAVASGPVRLWHGQRK